MLMVDFLLCCPHSAYLCNEIQFGFWVLRALEVFGLFGVFFKIEEEA